MSYLALYRKYRPQTFDEVVGQDSITRILKNQIKYNRVGHAYLFSGIRGTGKTSLAKIFAKAINCPNGIDGNPCNICDICSRIDQPGVMDIIEIDGASNRGVDEIREIRERIKYPPTVGKFKVYIIDEVHMLTKEAFNALLKTLEEPPEHAVFILATTEPNKCPVTILSRCQRYDIKPIPKELIIEQMKKICRDIKVEITDDGFDFIASRGDNSMRDALSLLDQVVDLQDERGFVSFDDLLTFTGMADKKNIQLLVKMIAVGDSSGLLLCLRELITYGKDSSLLLDQIIEYLRSVLITKTTKETAKEILRCSPEEWSGYNEMSEMISLPKLYHMISCLIEEKNKLKYSSLQKIIVEMALLKLSIEDVDETIHKPGLAYNNEISINSKDGISKQRMKLDESKEKPTREETRGNSERNLQSEPDSGKKNESVIKIQEQNDSYGEEFRENDEQPDIKHLFDNSRKKFDEKKLFKILCEEVGKTNSGQAMFLQRGEPTLSDDRQLTVMFSSENKNFFHFVNKPEFISSFEAAMQKRIGNEISLVIKLEEENFAELDMLEKTKRIVKNDAEKIINYESINEKSNKK